MIYLIHCLFAKNAYYKKNNLPSNTDEVQNCPYKVIHYTLIGVHLMSDVNLPAYQAQTASKMIYSIESYN